MRSFYSQGTLLQSNIEDDEKQEDTGKGEDFAVLWLSTRAEGGALKRQVLGLRAKEPVHINLIDHIASCIGRDLNAVEAMSMVPSSEARPDVLYLANTKLTLSKATTQKVPQNRSKDSDCLLDVVKRLELSERNS